MAYKKPKVLSFHGFLQFRQASDGYLNTGCTISVHRYDEYVTISHRGSHILYYTKSGNIKVPPFGVNTLRLKIINEYLPEGYEVIVEDGENYLLDTESNAKKQLSGFDAVVIANDRFLMYE